MRWRRSADSCSRPTSGAAVVRPDILDQARERLGPVILATDMIVEPGQEVTLSASLRSGLKLDGIEGKRLRFVLDDNILAEVRTDGRGNIVLKWKAPAKTGNSPLRAAPTPPTSPRGPVNDATLLVAARPKDARIVIVDLEKTVVASGFGGVLLGDAKPMDGFGGGHHGSPRHLPSST